VDSPGLANGYQIGFIGSAAQILGSFMKNGQILAVYISVGTKVAWAAHIRDSFIFYCYMICICGDERESFPSIHILSASSIEYSIIKAERMRKR